MNKFVIAALIAAPCLIAGAGVGYAAGEAQEVIVEKPVEVEVEKIVEKKVEVETFRVPAGCLDAIAAAEEVGSIGKATNEAYSRNVEITPRIISAFVDEDFAEIEALTEEVRGHFAQYKRETAGLGAAVDRFNAAKALCRDAS